MSTPEAAAGIIYDKIDEVASKLRDGIDLSDLAYCIRTAVECAELIEGQSGAAKREIAISFVKGVLHKTDGPGPDILIDPIIEAVAPPLIDLVVEAAKGKLMVNRDAKK